MDMFDCANYLKGTPLSTTPTSGSGSNSTNAHTITGKATSDSSEGYVYVDMGGDTVASDQSQSIKMATTVSVKNGDTVIINAAGADATGKSPLVIGVVGRGDETEEEIKTVSATASTAAQVAATAQKAADEAKETATATGQHFWDDTNGAHVSTAENSTSTGGSSTWNSNGMIIQKDGATLASHTGSGTNYYDSDGNVIASYNSSGAQIGKTSGIHTVVSTDGFYIEDSSGTELTSYGSSEEHLGKNAKTVKIYMCKDMGMIKFDSGLFNLIPADTRTCVSENHQAGVLLSTGTDVAGKKTQLAVLIDENSVSTMQIWADVLELWNNNNKHLHILMSDFMTMITPHKVLFDNDAQDFNQGVTLSESAANYNHMCIYYKTNDSFYGSVDVYSPNGKLVFLACGMVIMNSASAFYKAKGVLINGTTINTYQHVQGYVSGEVKLTGGTTTGTTDRIAITRVEAWNE